MLSITRRISKYNHYNNNNIKYLVIHDTGNYRDSASGNANYFNEGNKDSSAHYFIDDISIYQVVEDSNGAWHCGDGFGRYGITNTNSIGIEMCNSGGYTSEKTVSNTIELVKYLMGKYNIPLDRVVRHYDASRKCCPNNMSQNNWAKWNEFKNRIQGSSSIIVQEPTNIIRDDSVRDKKAKIVNVSTYLNIRYEPNGEIIGKLYQGNIVTLWRREGDWYHIYSPVPGYNQAYIHKNYVSLASTSASQLNDEKYGVVTANILNVRAGAGTGYSIIGQLNEGTKVRIASRQGNWYDIYFGDHGGFVSADYISVL